ncbi:uncharacterized protein ARMOST_16129 [Armillaria ostoyae]|uniref:Uncharacterized protein n=1 Tax=Armillaria ostoyae TaxID=47428 RepID=A0A284RVB2_ARMOS|nr:uncharacterized protein ARMOST_16129 [Armillaria ostoyae]
MRSIDFLSAYAIISIQFRRESFHLSICTLFLRGTIGMNGLDMTYIGTLLPEHRRIYFERRLRATPCTLIYYPPD